MSRSTGVADDHHDPGQGAGGSHEADQGLEEQRHGATPKCQATAPKDVAKLLPSFAIRLFRGDCVRAA